MELLSYDDLYKMMEEMRVAIKGIPEKYGLCAEQLYYKKFENYETFSRWEFNLSLMGDSIKGDK